MMPRFTHLANLFPTKEIPFSVFISRFAPDGQEAACISASKNFLRQQPPYGMGDGVGDCGSFLGFINYTELALLKPRPV